jgi:formylmethanofuran dehydrogenase subunit B
MIETAPGTSVPGALVPGASVPGASVHGASVHGAWIDGSPVSLAQAINAAASILAKSRSAVVAGLGTDIAGTRASIALARVIGASIDHMDAEAVFANLDVMRRAGWLVTTPLQVRTRADTVLLVGDGLLEAWPEIADRLGLHAPPTLAGGTRRIFHLCPGPTGRAPSVQVIEGLNPSHVIDSPNPSQIIDSSTPSHVIASQNPSHIIDSQNPSSPGLTRGPPHAPAPPIKQPQLLSTLAALRALANGRATSLDEAAATPLRTLAAALTAAHFGVAIWSAAALEPLAIEMLCGLIDDLNKTTRFAGLPLPPPNNAEGVTQAAAWITGFPIRTGFAGPNPLRDHPVHDPWRFDAQRLIANGEADAAIWISAHGPTPPPWGNAVPTIALVPTGTHFDAPPAVVFQVGHPGEDHDAMLYNPALGGIAFTAATTPQSIPTVAETITAITTALPPC